MTGILMALALAAAGCGGDDDGDSSEGSTASPVSSASPTDDAATDDAEGGAADELALGDPCELVSPATIGEIVSGDVTGELVNVDDGLPGATCTYTVAAGGTISLSITPGGATFYDNYKSQAESGGGIDPVASLGDDGFIYLDAEVVARQGSTMIQLQVFTSATTAATGGVEIMRRALEATSE